ncbi:hypothetical protein [Leptospira sp. 'Mane']|uniref:hypothetical protein n=1 Tax=Leptospira sp. 'Mane' TaxID=3387407 RepID=UPI00398A6F67
MKKITLVFAYLLVFCLTAFGCSSKKKEEKDKIDFLGADLSDPITLLLLYSLTRGSACDVRTDSVNFTSPTITIPATGTYSVCGNTGTSSKVLFASNNVNYSVSSSSGRASYSSYNCSSTSRTLSISFTKTLSSTTTTLVDSAATANADITSDTSAAYSIIGSGAPSLTCSGASVTPSLSDYRITFTAK